MWVFCPAQDQWIHLITVTRFFVTGSGTAWEIDFIDYTVGTATFQSGFLTKALAEAALTALVATFTA